MRAPLELEKIKETVEVLAGTRRGDKLDDAAVRLKDLEGILALPGRLQSVHSVGVPTKVEFDKLVDDVHELHRRLMAVSDALRDRKVL